MFHWVSVTISDSLMPLMMPSVYFLARASCWVLSCTLFSSITLSSWSLLILAKFSQEVTSSYSAMFSPLASSSGLTLSLVILLPTQKNSNPRPKLQAKATVTPRNCIPTCISLSWLRVWKGAIKARAMVPTAPPIPCTVTAPTGSSILRIFSIKSFPSKTRHPATIPITSAPQGSTLLEPAHMATRPPSVPNKVASTSNFLRFLNHPKSRQVTPPAPAAMLVFIIVRPTLASILRAEPPLKPNQPNQRKKVPMVARGILCPPILLAVPSLLYLPILGPTIMAPARANQPPTECTTVEPAKSIKPSLANQ